MTSERANAYGRVMKALSDLGPSKLHDDEQQLVRDAADTLLFADRDPDTTAVDAALADSQELAVRLVEADRLLPETAEALLEHLAACGPQDALAGAC